MRRFIGLIAASAAILGASAPAAHAASTKCEREGLKDRYASAYDEVADRHGERAPGRDIRRFGLTDSKPSRCADLRESLETLRRMLYVPKPAPARAPAQVSSASTAAAATSGYSAPAPAPSTGGGPEQFVQCESGGDWNAVNPSSGAYGRYQIMPMHYNGGMCSDLGRDPAGQTACANRIFDSQGSGAWSQCGG